MSTVNANQFSLISNSIVFVNDNLNSWLIEHLRLILAAARLLALLSKIEELLKNDHACPSFDCIKDYKCHYGVHSSGPFFEPNNGIEEKLLGLGLDKDEINVLFHSTYYDYERLGQRPLQLFLESRGDDGIQKSVTILKDDLEKIIREWRDYLERRPHRRIAAEFLLGLLPVEIVTAIFS